jgi:hypothetical protein
VTGSERDLAAASLEEIEGDRWGPAPEASSRTVATVHQLRRRPIGALVIEDLRLLVSQKVGLDTVVPLALERLRENPLAEGDYYPGDLLAAVLGLPEEHWRDHPAGVTAVRALLTGLDRHDEDYPVATGLDDLIAAFLERYPA